MRIIAGESKGRKLKSINGTTTRPTLDRVKESLFNIITPYIFVDRALDLFAGFGGLGLEALSRGVGSCTFVEKDYRNSRVITENIGLCNFEERATVKTNDVFDFLKKTEDRFDIIFMDPPYHKNIVEETIEYISDYNILRDDGLIIAEYEAGHELIINKSFKVLRQKTYGDSNICILSRGGSN